jgi:hypothetical protein
MQSPLIFRKIEYMADDLNPSRLSLRNVLNGQPILSASLISLAMIHPILIDWHTNPYLIEMCLSFILLSALVSALNWMRVLIVVCVSLRLIAFSAPAAAVPVFKGLADLATLFALASLFGLSVRWALLDTRLAFHRLCGAVNGYLLLGVFFCKLYLIIHSFVPDSLIASGEIAERLKSPVLCQDVICYFSFVTLTTIGYGDIVPGNSLVRTLAWIEPMLGQFYFAVVVAGLVSTLQSSAAVKRQSVVNSEIDLNISRDPFAN